MKYHYSDGTSDFGPMDENEIVQHIQRAPGKKHMVWKDGWAEWKDAREVLAAAMEQTPPSMYYYSDGTRNHGLLSKDEIMARVAAGESGTHLVWIEGWPEWKPAREILPLRATAESTQPAMKDAPPEQRHGGTEAWETSPDPAVVPPAEEVNHVNGVDGTKASSRVGGSGRTSLLWYGIGTAAVVILILIFTLAGSGSEDKFPGVYHVSGGSVDATIRIESKGDGVYRIKGESYYDTGNELGPNSGELDLEATLQDDILVARGEDGYVLRLRTVEDGIDAEEEGSNPYFGMNVSFAFRYLRTTEEALAERRATTRNASEDAADAVSEELQQYQPGGEPQVSLDIGSAEVLGLGGTWTASSTLENDDEKYGVANLDDMDATTVWAEGEAGSGEGLRLEFTPHDQEAGQIAGFRILNGHCRTRKLWEANARVRGIRVTSGGKQYSVELHDTPDWQYVYLPECTVDGPIVFEVISVYPGSKYEDLTISELGIVWELQSDE